MSTETEVVAAVETPAKKTVKKAVKKTAAPAAVKKAAEAKAAKPAKKAVKKAVKPAPEVAEKETVETPAKKAVKKAVKNPSDLKKKQVLILELLDKEGRPLTRKEVVDAGCCDSPRFLYFVGSLDEEKRLKADADLWPSLITKKYVKPVKTDEDGKDVIRFELTALGAKALEKIQAK